MGNWNRRYVPRKKFRHYDYEDPPLSPYNEQSYSSEVADSRVSSWEIDFCYSVRVPWNKVLASKKYVYCHPSVLNWDDSAGKEAFQNAKQRFWAMISGLPCDIPLPDPDIYIDEIDWSPYVDPELMADLDLQVFPDEAEKVEKLETINEGVECAQTWKDKKQDASGDPWERNLVQSAGSLKDLQGWSGWDDKVNLKNGDPWGQSCNQFADSLKDNAWGSGNESWGWNKGIDNSGSSRLVDYGCGNSWNFNGQKEGWGQGQGQGRGWGQGRGRGHRENNSWSRIPGNNNAEGLRNSVNCGYTFENKYSSGSKESGWRKSGNISWGARDAEYQGNEPKYWDSRGFRQGGSSFHGGGRKRESSIQHTSKYKSSRYYGDIYGDSHQL